MATLSWFWRWWMNTWLHRWQVHRRIPQFLRSAPEQFRGEVLEIGAGSGWTSQRILETFPQVELTATDIVLPTTDRFKHLLAAYGRRLKVEQANVLALPFDRESFDIVIAVNVMQHLKTSEIPTAVQQMLRVLRPGGLLGLSDTLLLPLSSRLTRQVLEQVLTDEGCHIIRSPQGGSYNLWTRKAYRTAASTKPLEG